MTPLVDCLVRTGREVRRILEYRWSPHFAGFEIACAGWSHASSAWLAHLLASDDLLDYAPAWQLTPVGTFATPFVSREHREALGIADTDAALTRLGVVEFGRRLMVAQRAEPADYGQGRDYLGVGGFCQATVLSADGMWSTIVERWPDVIDEPIRKASARAGLDAEIARIEAATATATENAT